MNSCTDFGPLNGHEFVEATLDVREAEPPELRTLQEQYREELRALDQLSHSSWMGSSSLSASDACTKSWPSSTSECMVVLRSWSRKLAAALAQVAPDIGRAQTLLIELGRQAIQENAQWLLLRRSKPIESLLPRTTCVSGEVVSRFGSL